MNLFYGLGYLGFLWPLFLLVGAGFIVVRFVMALFGVRTKTQFVTDESGKAVMVEPKVRGISGHLFRSSNDALYQTYMFLGTAFVGLFLSTINRSLGYPLGWETVQLLLTIFVLAIAYRFKVFVLLPVGIVGIISSVYWHMYIWTGQTNTSDILTIVSLVLLSVLIYGIGRLHDSQLLWRRYGMTYVFFGLIPVGIYLFFMSSETGIARLNEILSNHHVFTSFGAMFLIVLIALLIAVTFILGAMKKLISIFELIVGFLFSFLTLLLPFFPTPLVSIAARNNSGFTSYIVSTLNANGWILFIIMNILLFGYLVGWILVGYYKRERWAINTGSGLFALFVIIKFFSYAQSSAGQALTLIVAGLLLMILGVGLSVGRTKLLKKMDAATGGNGMGTAGGIGVTH